MNSKNNNIYEYQYEYKIVYYEIYENNENDVNKVEVERVIEGEIKREMSVRQFSFIDEYGSGYIYPINNNNNNEDDEENEYRVDGKCYCCMECFEDENCEGEGEGEKGICMDNVCVECKNDNDCEKEEICNVDYGNCLKSRSGLCRDNNDCEYKKMCNYDGKCVVGCRDDDNCGNNEICDGNGNCINGCFVDEQCQNEEMCINYKCSSSNCKDNFDCKDYDHVCINNECIFIENTQICSNDNDCSFDFYCDYEYFICVKKLRRETTSSIFNNRKKIEVLPAICSLYSVITFFFIASSYTIANNIAGNKLVDRCNEKCSNLYFLAKKREIKVDDYTMSEIRKAKKKVSRQDSECSGWCKWNHKLKIPEIIEYANTFCSKKILVEYITVDKKNDFAKFYPLRETNRAGSIAREIFQPLLSSYCKGFLHTYQYNYPSGRSELKTNMKICVANLKSIECVAEITNPS